MIKNRMEILICIPYFFIACFLLLLGVNSTISSSSPSNACSIRSRSVVECWRLNNGVPSWISTSKCLLLARDCLALGRLLSERFPPSSNPSTSSFSKDRILCFLCSGDSEPKRLKSVEATAGDVAELSISSVSSLCALLGWRRLALCRRLSNKCISVASLSDALVLPDWKGNACIMASNSCTKIVSCDYLAWHNQEQSPLKFMFIS